MEAWLRHKPLNLLRGLSDSAPDTLQWWQDRPMRGNGQWTANGGLS